MNISTTTKPTWCPGCWNFQILAGVKKALEPKIKDEKDRQKYAIVSGVGCHAKIYDYLNLNGINSLHGRVLPTCLGLKIGNPNLKVIGFSGDGDAYSEGIAHTIHAARYNADFNYIVHNNQVFALTVGQPTPLTESGYVDKTTPLGMKHHPFNPIKLMISAGATFVARVFAKPDQVAGVLEEAMKHKGFSFIEVIQPCLVFHQDKDYMSKTYNLQEKGHDKSNYRKAMEKAEEFNYDGINEKTRIPLGIFYQTQKPTYEEKFPQLHELKKKGIGWKDIKR